MNYRPLISIVIPVYNTAPFLTRCLETVFNQSYSFFETIIVNDGSTDESHSIINQIIGDRENVKYIHLTENSGVGNARNIGINTAKGEYIGFVDSDDWIDYSFYESILDYMNSNNSDIGIAGIKTEIDDTYYPRSRYTYHSSYTTDNVFGLHSLVNLYNHDTKVSPIVNNKLYRLSLIKDNEVLFDSSRRAQDNYFSFLVLLYAKKISFVSDTFYHYYQRPFSATHDFSKSYVDDYTYVLNSLKHTLEQRGLFKLYYAEFTSYVIRCCTALINNLFSQEQNDNEQKKHLLYIFNKIATILPWEVLLDKIDIERFKRFWDAQS